jgi:hypothetical protein
MGEEDPSQRPFVFFAQHDEGLAQSIREGRRREFESTANAVDDLPVPTIPRPSSSPSPKGIRSSRQSALLSTAGFWGYDANIFRPRGGCASYRRTCDRPGCGSLPRETRRGKTLAIAVNLSEQVAAWPAHDALADQLYREGDFLFEAVEGVYSENRGGSLPRRAWCRLCRAGTPGAWASDREGLTSRVRKRGGETLRRFGGLRPARSARRSRPSPRPLHRARPRGLRSRPPGLPPSGSGSLSTCP